MRLSIRPVGSQVGGNGINLLAELFVHGIDFLAEAFIYSINLLVQGVDLEINQIKAFIGLAAKLTNLSAKHFMPFEDQIKLAADLRVGLLNSLFSYVRQLSEKTLRTQGVTS